MVSGGNDTVNAANSRLTATIGGTGQYVYGGFTSLAGALAVLDDGTGDTINGANSPVFATLAGAAGTLYGSFTTPTTLTVAVTGTADTVNAANSDASVDRRCRAASS